MSNRFFAGLDDLTPYFHSVGRVEMMNAAEESRVARLWQTTKKQRHADRLVAANLRFVIKIALEYKNYGFALPDLIQEGNLGLVRAVQSFDPDKGFRLISYAVWWIRAYIQEYILKNWSLVKIGTTQLQRRLFNHLQSSQKRLDRLMGTGSETSRREALAKAVGGTVQDVEEMERRVGGRDLSIDRGTSEEEGSYSLHDRLSEEEGDGESLLEQQELAAVRTREISKALDCLAQRERQIVMARHLSDRNITLRELGEELGISKERVRQLENRALRVLRDTLSCNDELRVLMAG